MELNCYNCQTKNVFPSGRVSRFDSCDHCGVSLHSCSMCALYDKRSYNECKEPMAERIVDKEKANYCDYFSPTGDHADKKDEKEDLMAKANALFKN